jgi:hypothetical protein
MQKIDFLLQKRSGKLLPYLGAAVFLLPMSIGLIIGLIGNFQWTLLVVAAIIGAGDYFVFSALYEYFIYKDVRLVVESDGQTIKFFNTNAAGKVFNESEDFKLADMARFYTVQKTTRYFIKNFYYAFEGKGSLASLLKDDVTPFPSLYEATEADHRSVLSFVSSVAPHIELGYENIWQKMTK